MDETVQYTYGNILKSGVLDGETRQSPKICDSPLYMVVRKIYVSASYL